MGEQWHDQVVEGVCQGTAVPGEPFPCQDIGTEDLLIDLGSLPFKPGEQGRTEIAADAGVVVGDLPDEALPVKDSCCGIGQVALISDSLVPVMPGCGRSFPPDHTGPWILS
jgi:hypothetical protein